MGRGPGGPGTGGRGPGGPGPGGPGRVRLGRNGKPKRTWKQWTLLGVKWATAGFLVFVLIGVGAFVYLYKTVGIPDPNKSFQTQTSFIYYANGKSKLGEFSDQNRTSIPYGKMPSDIRNAVVAAEDRTFWTNHGIDPKGIVRAAFSDARGNATQGASTITQQYVKILYLNQERSVSRKLKEAIISLKIQRTMTKQQILAGYLNTIYFGRGAYGIEAAAEAYFGVHAPNLTLKQAAVIASVLNDPYGLDPANGKDAKAALKKRYDYVLSGMASMGTVRASAAKKAEKSLPAFPKVKADNQYAGQKGHALTLVKNELVALGFTPEQIEGGGLRVTTTLTRKDMAAAQDGVEQIREHGTPDGAGPALNTATPALGPNGKKQPSFGSKNLHIAVAEVQPGTGALRGFYGGQNYLQSETDWAVAGGMVGSTMKPVTLATALEAGYSLKSTFQGTSPYRFPNGETVANEGQSPSQPFGESYGQHVTATYALQQSINTAFIDMTQAIPDGTQKIYDNAVKMGIAPNPDLAKTQKGPHLPVGIPSTTLGLEPTDPRITLGKAVISPINMANTYATIANGGERANVHVVDRVTDASGKVLYQYQNATTQAIPQDVADDVSYALQQTAIAGTGETNASPSDLGRPDGGKTGTATADGPNGSQYVSSAWYVGITPQLSTAVVYTRGDGNDSLEGWLPTYFGMEYPASTWTAVMKRALVGVPIVQFPPPANVTGTPPMSGHDPALAFTPKPKKKARPSAPPTSLAPPAFPTHGPKPQPSFAPPTQPTEPTEPTPSAPPSSEAPPTTPPGGCGILGCPTTTPTEPGDGNGNGGSPPGQGAPGGTAATAPADDR